MAHPERLFPRGAPSYTIDTDFACRFATPTVNGRHGLSLPAADAAGGLATGQAMASVATAGPAISAPLPNGATLLSLARRLKAVGRFSRRATSAHRD